MPTCRIKDRFSARTTPPEKSKQPHQELPPNLGFPARGRAWRLAALAGLVGWCLTFSPPIRGDFIIIVPDYFFQAGVSSTAYIPVYIRWSGAGPATLANTSFEFRLTSTGPTQLSFMNSPAPVSDPTFSNANYVFFGDSFDVAFSQVLGTAHTSGGGYSNDTFIGGDSTNSGVDVTLTTADRLLAMLPVTTSTGLPPAEGDLFTLSLVPASAPGFSGHTGFGDSSPNFWPYSSFSGRVSVVPEPATLAVSLVGGLGLLVYMGGRKWRWGRIFYLGRPAW